MSRRDYGDSQGSSEATTPGTPTVCRSHPSRCSEPSAVGFPHPAGRIPFLSPTNPGVLPPNSVVPPGLARRPGTRQGLNQENLAFWIRPFEWNEWQTNSHSGSSFLALYFIDAEPTVRDLLEPYVVRGRFMGANFADRSRWRRFLAMRALVAPILWHHEWVGL